MRTTGASLGESSLSLTEICGAGVGPARAAEKLQAAATDAELDARHTLWATTTTPRASNGRRSRAARSPNYPNDEQSSTL